VRDNPIAYPGKNYSEHKQQPEKDQGCTRELRKHHERLISGRGDHPTHDSAKRDHAVDIKADVHESAQATRGRAQKRRQCILSPPAFFDDARHTSLTGHFDKIDQKHHHKDEKADHESMFEDRQGFHTFIRSSAKTKAVAAVPL